MGFPQPKIVFLFSALIYFISVSVSLQVKTDDAGISSKDGEKQKQFSVLFVVYCSKGHLNPNIGLANELIANGHVVDMFLTTVSCGAEVQRRMPDVRNVIPTTVTAEIFVNPHAFILNQLHMAHTLFVTNHTIRTFDFLSEHLKSHQYDVIVADDFVPGAVICAKAFKIPVVTTAVNSLELLYKEEQERGDFAEKSQTGNDVTQISPIQDFLQDLPFFGVLVALHYARSDSIFKFAQKIHSEFGLKLIDDSENDGQLPLSYFYRHALIISFGSPDLNLRNVSKFHETDTNIYFAGHVPEAKPADTNELTGKLLEFIEQSENPVIFVSLGTVINLEFEILLRVMKEFETQTKYRIIWAVATGNFTQLELEQTRYDNLFLARFVPQTAVLDHEKTKIFLTHCGANSVQDSLYAAKPMLTYPGFGDQVVKDKRISNLGIGVHLNEFSFLQIDKELTKMLEAQNYNSMVEKLNVFKRQMVALGGFKTAAKLVEKIASSEIKVNEKAGDQLGSFSNVIFYISCVILLGIVSVVTIAFCVLRAIYRLLVKKTKPKAE